MSWNQIKSSNPESFLHPLREALGNSLEVLRASSLGGGSINQVEKLDVQTDSGKMSIVVKWNHATEYPGMMAAEAQGLQFLRDAGVIPVPEVYANGESGNLSWLALEWIEESRPSGQFWENFGRNLAKLHKSSDNNGLFGLGQDNWIGSLPQSNDTRKTWGSFFYEKRLKPQFEMARKQGQLGEDFGRALQGLSGKLEILFPEEPPALLHGDLWSGNFLRAREAVLIDPAVYFGHREMDLGMSRLFGGFQGAFYRSYDEEYPLVRGWEERLEVCNLYPLLVHVNLFGGGYASQAWSVLRRFA